MLAFVLLASTWVQSALLQSGFYMDDFLWLYRIENLPWLEFVLKTHGGHLLHTRNAMFAVCHALFGLEPTGYLWVALLTHVLNVALLFVVIERLSGRPLVAALIAALWGMAPIHQEALRWVSVHGHVFAATFLLAALADMARLVARSRPPTSWALMRWTLLLLLAATSFGTGLGVAAAFVAIVWLVLPRGFGRGRTVLLFAMLTVVLTVAYFAVERSLGLVAARLLVFKSIALSSNLAAYGLASLALGPLLTWTREGGLAGPVRGAELGQALYWAYAVSLTLLVALGWACRRASPTRLRQILGFALLAGCAYGTIAVARAPVLEALKLDMSWMATTARYHYLPQLGLAMALGLAFSEAWRRRGSQRRPSRPRWLVPVVFAGGLAMLAPFYAAAARRVATEIGPGWREALDSVVKEVQRRAHAAPPGEPVYIPNRSFQDWRGWASREDFPGWAAVFVMAHASDSIEGRRVFFVEPDEELVRSLREDPGARISRLVVTPHEVDRALDGPDPAR
jgi:hypothetical protein